GNVAVFNKAGIVANRGVAVCDGRVFVLNIDMTITMLNQQTGDLMKRVPISSAVPGAATRYGYTETSAPICAEHRVITGAAGSEYGVRGFVMAFKSKDLSPAWANPVWSIPPSGMQWRRVSRIVGVYPGSIGGLNFSPAAYDPKTNYIFNAAAETAAVMIQKKLTPTQKRRKRLEGDIFLGLQNGDFGSYLPGWHDHGSISAIDVN